MKVSCLQENLEPALKRISPALPRNATLPITANVKLETVGGNLRLTTTNLEIALVTTIGARVEVEGAITIPARLFADTIASMPKDRVDLSVDGKNVTIACGGRTVKIVGQSADEYPPVPSYEGNPLAIFDAADLRDSIRAVDYCAATDYTRPIMTAINVQLRNGGSSDYTLAAADGFRLAVKKGDAAVEEDATLNVPVKAMTVLAKLIGKPKRGQSLPSVELYYNPPVIGRNNGLQVLFTFGTTTLVTQLQLGTYPDYPLLIPDHYTAVATMDAASMLGALRPVTIMARDASGIVRLRTELNQFQDEAERGIGTLTLSAQAEEEGQAKALVDAMLEGEAKIAFNGRYLTDLLSVFGDGLVRIETNKPSDLGVFRRVGDDSWVQVVMPMFVQW